MLFFNKMPELLNVDQTLNMENTGDQTLNMENTGF